MQAMVADMTISLTGTCSERERLTPSALEKHRPRRSGLCWRSRLAQQPKECCRDGCGQQRTEEQPQRADAFLLENLCILQDANPRRVRRVGNHQRRQFGEHEKAHPNSGCAGFTSDRLLNAVQLADRKLKDRNPCRKATTIRGNIRFWHSLMIEPGPPSFVNLGRPVRLGQFVTRRPQTAVSAGQQRWYRPNDWQSLHQD